MNRRFILTLLISVMLLPLLAQPRIVNIVNFIRQNDYRLENSEARLLEATQRELELVRQYQLPATFLLQYDALIDEHYQQLLKQAGKDVEIGAWWEITQPHVEAAGIVWRGNHRWVSTANIAFTTGYTQAERKQLVDVYMERFHDVFGRYPRSVGSWYVDAWTLDYMHKRYGVLAACNCKDQIGTDGYTLWGGYWGQAYYPSKVNGYMPAQTRGVQVDVPVFRMLGSDPIHQYDSGLGGNGQGVITLEPVYPYAGGSRSWTTTFLDAIADEPCLAFNYAQAGQENSFTWPEIEPGLSMQIPIIAEMQRAGRIDVWTLEQCGTWFRKHYDVTPATAFPMTHDPLGQGNQTMWYNSRYYRANVLLDSKGHLRFRDIHLFDERMQSPYHEQPGESSHFIFETLPVVDGQQWSTREVTAGLRLQKLVDGGTKEMVIRDLKITERGKDGMRITGTNQWGERLTLDFTPQQVSIRSTDVRCQWMLELRTGDKPSPVRAVTRNRLDMNYLDRDYSVLLGKGFFQRFPDTEVRWVILPQKGKIEMKLIHNS